MRKFLAASALLCASLALAAAAQKQSGQKPTARADDAKAQTGTSRPKVTEFKEDGLKSLLKVGEARERPLLVNFWATWCAPCREEFPDLVKIRGRYAAGQLDFALVSLDDPSDIDAAVPDFLLESGASALPAYLLNSDDDGAAINLVDPQWGGELPATFLYDRSGRLVFNHKGRIKPAELQDAIDKTLGPESQATGSKQ